MLVSNPAQSGEQLIARLTLHDLHYNSRLVHRLHTLLRTPNRVRFSKTLIRAELLPFVAESLVDLDIVYRRESRTVDNRGVQRGYSANGVKEGCTGGRIIVSSKHNKA